MTGWVVVAVAGAGVVEELARRWPRWAYHWRRAGHVIAEARQSIWQPPARQRVLPVTAAVIPYAAVAGQPPWPVLGRRPELLAMDAGAWIDGPCLDPGELDAVVQAALDEEDPGGWTGPLLRDLRELPTSLDDLGPGAGSQAWPGYNSHLPSGSRDSVKVDSPAPDSLPGEKAGRDAPPPERPPGAPEPTRLLRSPEEHARAVLAADVHTWMARQDAAVMAWLAGLPQQLVTA